MPDYRRMWVPGGTFFFTVNLLERRRTLLIDHLQALRWALLATRARWPFTTIAMVVLPDHLHCIWQLPPGDADYATRWRLIKARFAHAMTPGERRSSTRIDRCERGIWQRRYWEHWVRDEHDLHTHIDYIHHNPVKHGLVTHAEQWRASTIHAWSRLAPRPTRSERADSDAPVAY